MRPLRFLTVLRRRLRLPLPLGPARGRCGHPLDELGDHAAACAASGLLKLRAGPQEKAWGQVLREAGARVQGSGVPGGRNQYLRDMGLETEVTDDRAVELVARDLPLYHGLPLACDATLASPLHANGTARPGADEHAGTAIAASEDAKAVKYPELCNSQRVRLMVLASEVGGRWSDASLDFVRRLAAAKAAGAPPPLREATATALQARWWALLAVATQDALAATLLGDAPHLLHGNPAEEEPLGRLLLEGAEAPAPSRLPLR